MFLLFSPNFIYFSLAGHNFFPIQLVEHDDGENDAKKSEQDADFSKSPNPDNLAAIYLPVEKKVCCLFMIFDTFPPCWQFF